MTFDLASGLTVLHGGYDATGRALGDTWTWDGSLWTQASPLTMPSARGGHALAFDPVRGRTLLFGGVDAQTWEWNGSTWSRVYPASSPPARDLAAMTTDTARGVVVLVGGHAGFGIGSDEHWEWNGTNWTFRSHAPFYPRLGHGLAFDAARRRVVMFGGGGRTPGGGDYRYPSDTFEWDGSAWREAAPPTNPDGQLSFLSFDHARGQVFGYGFTYGLAWHWNGVRWARSTPSTRPPDRWPVHANFASDPIRGRITLFGGYANGSYVADTWEWDGNDWLQRFPNNRPSARSGHAMAWFSRRQRVVLFGGGDNQTWEWDGNDWLQRGAPIAPNARSDHVMAEDEARGVLVLYGGNPGPVYDTWEWDGTAWSFRPVVGPMIRPSWNGLVYDRARQRVVLHGENATTSGPETWEYDGIAWVQRSAAPVRPAGLAFDPIRGVAVRYGGSDEETWEYGPTHPASMTTIGAGCTGTRGIPSLTTHRLPWLGDTLTLEASNLSTGPAAMLFGSSDMVWNGVPLPFDLGSLGMPGCWLRVDPAVVLALAVSAGTGTFRLPIALDPQLLGLSLYAQAVSIDPPANPFGAAVSNGLRITIGGR
ncbi:MAG: hypothetical protein IPM29_00320 [Planctomycetes bacterium]|nr:hypothetical protein [Planctomycetota bacterium]